MAMLDKIETRNNVIFTKLFFNLVIYIKLITSNIKRV
jgi:hypothetical protein